VALQQEALRSVRSPLGGRHKALIQWLLQTRQVARLVGGDGIYSLEVALALDREERIEVAVLNRRRSIALPRHATIKTTRPMQSPG